jgi:hypothetical protein
MSTGAVRGGGPPFRDGAAGDAVSRRYAAAVDDAARVVVDEAERLRSYGRPFRVRGIERTRDDAVTIAIEVPRFLVARELIVSVTSDGSTTVVDVRDAALRANASTRRRDGAVEKLLVRLDRRLG